KVALHKVAQISKKGKFFADHFRIRFDLTQFDSIRFDLTQFDSNRFDLIRIRFRFGQFGFDSDSIRFRLNRISSIRTESNFINSDRIEFYQFGPNRISSIQIRFEDYKSESYPN